MKCMNKIGVSNRLKISLGTDVLIRKVTARDSQLSVI